MKKSKLLFIIFILLFIFSCSDINNKKSFMATCTDTSNINNLDSFNFNSYCECCYNEIIDWKTQYNNNELDNLEEIIRNNCVDILYDK